MIAIPRPAATVILKNEKNEVYLTKRPETMKFLGGYFVFPGGSVDEADYEFHSDLMHPIQLVEKLFHSAYYIAASRELFEEIGILLVKGENLQLRKSSSDEYRRKLLKREISFITIMREEGLILDLNYLQYMGHRVTPKKRPIRFDTRFFLANLPSGQTPQPDFSEISEAFWVTPREAIVAYKNNKIKLAPPTLVALQTIMDYVNGGSLLMPDRQNESQLY